LPAREITREILPMLARAERKIEKFRSKTG
jgi:hypothetical protein